MQKHTFKILGGVLFAVLLVSLCVGSVSAEPTKIWEGSVDIVEGTYFSAGGIGIPFETDLGVLALASLEQSGRYDFTSGTVIDSKYNITHLGTETANATHRWTVFVNQNDLNSVYLDNQPLQTVKQGDIVTAYFVAKGNTTQTDAKNNATHVVKVTVNSVKPLEPIKVSVSLDAGTFKKTGIDNYEFTNLNKISGIGALQAAAYKSGISYNIKQFFGGVGIADIDGIGNSADSAKLGYCYGWGIYNNGIETPTTIEAIPITAGDKLTLYYCPGSYYVNIDGLETTGYNYLTSSLYTLEITIEYAEGAVSIGPSTANILWSIDMAESYAGGSYEFVPDGSPVVKDGKVYFTAWGGNDAQNGVYCFDAVTGKKIWATTGITSRSGVAVYGEYLYVGYMQTVNGEHVGGVKCLKIADGNIIGDTGAIYKHTSNGYVGLTSTPIVYNDRVWIYSPTSKENGEAVVYSYDTSLSSASKTSLSVGGTCGGMYSSPTLSPNGILYVPAGKGIAAVDTSTNTVLWKYEVNAGSGTVGTPVYHDYIVYFIVADSKNPDNGKIYAVDTTSYYIDSKTNQPVGPFEKWSKPHAAEVPTAPVIDDSTVYATGKNGLTAYAVADGKKQWQHAGGNAGKASPALANGMVYYGTYDTGTLYGISTTAGTEVWKLKPLPGIAGRLTIFEARPAILDGVLYVGCEGASTFYAISDSGDSSTAHLQNIQRLQQQQLELQQEELALQQRELQLQQQELYYLQQQGMQVQESDRYYTLINPGSGTISYTTNHPSYPKTTFTFDRMTIAGVLLASGNTVVTAERWGGLYITSINGVSSDNDANGGWMYQVNGKSVSSMANSYRVNYGDTVVFYYSSSMDSTPANSKHVYAFKVSTGNTLTEVTETEKPAETPTQTPADSKPENTKPTDTETIPTETTPAETPAPILGVFSGILACFLVRKLR